MNIKSFTDLEQSKKLSGILPLDSADHCFLNDGTAIKAEINSYNVALQLWKDHYVEIIPAWSLSALMEIIKIDCHIEKSLFDQSDYFTYAVYDTDNPKYRTYEYDNPIDAVVDMIYKLKEDGEL